MGTGAQPGHFHLFFGTVLCFIGVAMIVYVILRPDRRRRPVLVGAAAHLLAGFLWVLSGVALDAPGWIQVLLGALRALPWDLALAYVCHLVARSVGANHPRTASVLGTGAYVLPCLPILTGVVCAVYFPQPAIDYLAPGTPELLVPRARNVVEAGYLALVTSVFLRESLRRSTKLLRVQNFALATAGLSLFVAISANIAIAAARAFVSDLSLLLEIVDECHDVQLVAMVCAGAGFLVGIVLYYSAEEREALLERCREWVRHRHEIEAAAHTVFGTGLGASASGAKTAGYFYRAAAMLEIPGKQQEQGRLTVILLALMLDPRHQERVSEVQAAQRELLEAPEFAGLHLGRLGSGIQYDIRDDALYNALGPARTLSGSAPEPQAHTNRLPPVWVQLAAALAADARFLPEPTRAMILSGRSRHASPRVLDAYRTAKGIENNVA